MTIAELKTALASAGESLVTLELHDGGGVPAHYHVTEVGFAVKEFIDCGGTVRKEGRCVLQIWVADDVDHRVTAEKFAKILEHGAPGLPTDALEVEIEYEYPVMARFPLVEAQVTAEGLRLKSGLKHTDCLAKDVCGISSNQGDPYCNTEGCC